MRRRMAWKIVLPVAFGVLAVCARADEDWRALFDHETLDGWEQVGPGGFVVEDGVLRSRGGMGMLWYTREKFQDVVLRVEFKLGNPDANSGVFIRIPTAPATPWTAVHGGYEVQIDERGDDHHRTGVLYSLTRALARPALVEWNTLEITQDGPRTLVRVNGETVTDYREGDPVAEKAAPYEPDRGPRPNEGYIGLQNHADRDLVYFRNIDVRPLAATAPD